MMHMGISWITLTTMPLSDLAGTAIRALILAGVAGFALFAFRVKATSVRLFTWTGVLYAALAMPFLGHLLPAVPVPLPEFLHSDSQDRSRQSQSHLAIVTPVPAMTSPAKPAGTSRHVSPPRTFVSVNVAEPASPSRSTSHFWTDLSWTSVAWVIYLAVSLILLVRFTIGIILSRRLVRASQPIEDQPFASKLAWHAQLAGAPAPHVAETELISVPVTVGAVGSTILLPTNWREWTDAKLDAVLAHEISHVTRHDALTQRISRLHCAIFWFSPLAWWLDQHLSALAEQASDEAALARGADRDDYARTLLAFFETLQAVPGRVWWQGVSMASTNHAEERLKRILTWRGAVAMNSKKSVILAIILVAVPMVYLTASARPGVRSSQQVLAVQVQTAPPAAVPALAAAPSSVAAPAPPAAPTTVPMMAPPAPASAPIGRPTPRAALAMAPPAPASAPVAVAMPAPPAALWSGQSHGSGPSHSGFFYGDNDQDHFVIVLGNSDSLTMSGTGDDAEHVQRLRRTIQGDFIWFERDDKSYVIRDQATIDRAHKLWAEEEDLGKKQEELGAKQEALGKEQEELGSKMEQVRVNVPDITAELDKLKAKLQALGSTATVDQISELQSEIGELQEKMGSIQEQAGEQQSKLGDQQGSLGEKQAKLGEEQARLGEKQADLARKATLRMKSLLDEAIKTGKAKPETGDGGGASL